MLNRVKRFLENTSGSIAPTMGILSIPLAITAGAAVDYTRYVNMRTEVQTGIDAAAIATVKALPELERQMEANLSNSAYAEKLETKLNDYAEGFLKANITSKVAKDAYEFDIAYTPSTITNQKSTIEISAEIKYDTIFGGLDGDDGGILLFKDTITDNIVSLIQTGNRTVEIALVVDNSGSMVYEAGNLESRQNPAPVDDRRITKLKTAAKKLVSDLFAAGKNSQLENPVQFSVVPFSSSVNVGNINHKNHKNNNRFLDINGFASYHNENLDWVNTYRKKSGEKVTLHKDKRAARLTRADGSKKWLTRLDIFPMMNTQWEGCVEMRPYPHNVQDTYQANNKGYNSSDAEKLFVPYMVPDAPDEQYFGFYSDDDKYISTVNDAPTNGSREYSSNYIPDFYDYNADAELALPMFRNDNLFPSAIDNGDINNNQITRTNWIHKYQAYQGLVQSKINQIPNRPLRNKQLKRILNALNVPVFGKDLSRTNSSYFNDSGPNAFCPDIPVLQLTENQTELNNTIESMQAHGGTNIQQGLTWGWRTLSAAKPFDTGRSLDDANNRKILILLTDGNNQMLTEDTKNNTYYTSWGYQRTKNVLKHATTGANSHGRLLKGDDDVAGTIYDIGGKTLANNPTKQSDYEALMNLHTNQACNNIKNDGITIYTIAFDVPSGSLVKELLENCAGPGIVNQSEIVRGVRFYHDVIGLELDKVFAEITESISAIRIAQ